MSKFLIYSGNIEKEVTPSINIGNNVSFSSKPSIGEIYWKNILIEPILNWVP